MPFVSGGAPPPVDHSRHLPVMSMLDELRVALFADGGRPGRMGVQDLKDITRRLGVPRPLCGALELHYLRFREQLADPHLYDGVLDLYDTYATLYAFLTDFLPEFQRRARAAGRPSAPFGKWLCEQVGDLLVAVGNAADHRVRLPLPDADRPDTAVDLRGGLSKLVAAADVPLKCGLHLVNRAIGQADTAPADTTWPHRGLPLNRVGAITLFNFDPQTRCKGVYTRGGKPYSLTFVSMDVSHVFRPIRLLAHLHEAAHLVTHFTDDLRACAGRDQPVAADLTDELYAELLTHLMVFGTNTDLYLKQQVAGYATSPQGQGSGYSHLHDEDHYAEERFYRHLLTAFLVTEPIRAGVAGRNYDPRTLPRDGLRAELADRPRAISAFLDLIKRYGPFHAQFARWRADPDFDTTWAAMFADDIADWGDTFAAAWEAAFDRFRAHDWGLNTALSQTVGRAVLTGRPVVHPHAGDDDQVDDAVQIVSQLLYAHAKFCYQPLDPAAGVHLPRREDTGAVDFASAQPPGGRWNVFQLDATHGALFCVDPVVRRARVRLEVTLLKSLWDVSTHIRAERLAHLIQSLGWSEAGQEPTESSTFT